MSDTPKTLEQLVAELSQHFAHGVAHDTDEHTGQCLPFCDGCALTRFFEQSQAAIRQAAPETATEAKVCPHSGVPADGYCDSCQVWKWSSI